MIKTIIFSGCDLQWEVWRGPLSLFFHQFLSEWRLFSNETPCCQQPAFVFKSNRFLLELLLHVYLYLNFVEFMILRNSSKSISPSPSSSISFLSSSTSSFVGLRLIKDDITNVNHSKQTSFTQELWPDHQARLNQSNHHHLYQTGNWRPLFDDQGWLLQCYLVEYSLIVRHLLLGEAVILLLGGEDIDGSSLGHLGPKHFLKTGKPPESHVPNSNFPCGVIRSTLKSWLEKNLTINR